MRYKFLILGLLITVMSYSQIKTFSAIRILDSLSIGGSAYIDTIIDYGNFSANFNVDSLTTNYLLLPNDTIFGAADTFVISNKTKINGDTIFANGDTLIAKAMWVKNTGWSISPATSNWSVGIGTATPRGIFEVAGKILFNTNFSSTSLGAGAGNGDHHRNTLIGHNAGKSITHADNTVVGAFGMMNSSYVRENTVIGSFAGYNNTGNGNVLLGYKSGYYETGSDKLYISNSNTTTPLIYGEFNNKKLIVNGQLEVSTTTGAFIVPRLTTAQRTALTTTNGSIVYDTDLNVFYFFENNNWVTK